ncbi:hypothetical protein Taro_044898 [Colocasia esculenta]|uniref:Succinate dehydogenase/fumarate reductase N-terminal domain-containing protein n=1 Tax=Colocasia esculenta TaxID=4460 RepID=A0A843X3Y8_COLES|nr:hypothetical protein [Colocasia esculenta]
MAAWSLLRRGSAIASLLCHHEIAATTVTSTPTRGPLLHLQTQGHSTAVTSEAVPSSATGKKAPNMKTFQIYRWSPEDGGKPKLEEFQIDLNECGPMGICGSCAMNIDGGNGLACLTKIKKDQAGPMMIMPLPHMFVMKYLVVDMTNFYV